MRGSVWFLLVYKSFIPHISYTRMHCGVPTASFSPFRTSEAPPVYQPCPPSLSVPHRGPSPVPNTFRIAVRTPEAPSPVPNTFRSAVCTPEALLLYRTRFGVRFVPQRSFSCTELCRESFRASESLILCRVHPNKCTMWLLAYGKMALLMSIRVAEKQKSESGAI